MYASWRQYDHCLQASFRYRYKEHYHYSRKCMARPVASVTSNNQSKFFNPLVTLVYNMHDMSEPCGYGDSSKPPKAPSLKADERTLFWLMEGSEIMSSVVQVFIWEWATMWLIVMIFATLLYNGFFTSALRPNSWLRTKTAIDPE